jgi:tetratricopeptide (TPR) repeat protein
MADRGCRASVSGWLVAVVVMAAGVVVPSAGAQGTAGDALQRAMTAEDQGDRTRAAVAYREVLQQALTVGNPDGNRVAIALLGLERVWAEAGALDSIVPVARRVLQLRPTDPTAHTVHLRTLVTMGRDDEARTAFTLWRRVAGTDGAPYREYARLLMQQGRALAADSLLSDAARLLGAGGALSGETAQLHVSLGRWQAAAAAYREALVDQPWLETAALYGLQRTPAASRDSVRAVFLADPPRLLPRRLLSSLEFAWSEPRRAWQALAALPADDSTTAAWRAFGERAEMNESWLVARDAWAAVFERTSDLESQRRSADAALRAGDAAGALTLLARRSKGGDDAARRRALLPIEIAALGEVGRVADAQRTLDAERSRLDDGTRAALARPLVGAWLRAGDLTRAKAAMEGTDLAEDDEIAGTLALYEGDLVTARKRLVRAATQRPELVDALGILARVRLDQSPGLGSAFLLLAKRDSAAAAARFTQLADSVGTAAPALLAQAARLSAVATAVPMWERIVRDFPKSPEAPESLLSWARVLRDRGDKAGATARLEQLLIEYSDSALAPQARRELERLKGMVPPR